MEDDDNFDQYQANFGSIDDSESYEAKKARKLLLLRLNQRLK